MKKLMGKRKGGRTSKKDRLECIRGKLLERRSRLVRDIAIGLENAVEQGGRLPEDAADQACHTVGQETTFQAGAFESHEVNRIDEALEMIEEGTYGICRDCGCRIPASRLKALLFAATCLECQRSIESQGVLYESPSIRDIERLGSFSGVSGEGELNVALARGQRRFV
jgi:RNA polymerase-binding transcription factor